MIYTNSATDLLAQNFILTPGFSYFDAGDYENYNANSSLKAPLFSFFNSLASNQPQKKRGGGCPKFFEFHRGAGLPEYAERFGYDPTLLQRTVKSSREYRELKNNITDDKTLMREVLISLDTKGVTERLYDRQERQMMIRNTDIQSAPITTYIQPEIVVSPYSQTTTPQTQYDAPKITAYGTDDNELYEGLYDVDQDGEESEIEENEEDVRDIVSLLVALQLIEEDEEESEILDEDGTEEQSLLDFVHELDEDL